MFVASRVSNIARTLPDLETCLDDLLDQGHAHVAIPAPEPKASLQGKHLRP